MKVEQFRREKDYGASLAIARNLLKRELITAVEYRKIKAALIGKYLPVICSLHVGTTAASPPRSGQKQK